MTEVIITIEEYPSMPGRFNYTLMKDKRRVLSNQCAGYDSSAAAAKAVELAINHSKGGAYYIFAPQKVMNLIPEHLRSGSIN